ncbi:MAG: Sensor histidine kinase RcsC [Fimbriimonadaceae bacterium]|nr:Sensor histidine kinase RcsC [Fimbriimonadaceae bacterium]
MAGSQKKPSRRDAPVRNAAIVVLAVTVATGLRLWLDLWLGDHLPYVTYFVAVAVVALLTSTPATVCTVFASWIAADFFFVQPRGSVIIDQPDLRYFVGTLSYFVAGFAITVVSDQMRRAQQRISRQDEVLQATAARHQAVFDTVVDGIITIDERGIIESSNPAVERLFGYTADELVGQNVAMLMPDPYAQEHDSYLDNYKRTGNPKIIGIGREVVGRRKDGSQFPMDLAVSAMNLGSQRMFTGLVRDVTIRKQAEGALRASEERFRTMADAAPVLIWMSGPDKLCTWFNKVWLDFVGRSMDEELGNGWAENVHPEDFDQCLETYSRSFDAREPFSMEYRLKRHDGEYRWLLDHGIPRYSVEGEFAGYIGSCLDITERSLMEKQIGERAEELATESRRKDEFLAMLSHELRNPLAPIQTAVELLRLQDSDDAVERQTLDILHRQVANLARLVNDLLEVSRVVSGRIRIDLAVLDANQVLRNAVQTVQPLIEARRHELLMDLCPEGAAWVNADATRLEQVFTNLLSNAVKYTDEGGRIEVFCEVLGDRAEVQVRVRDNGIGIAPNLLPHIFDLFTQADSTLDHSRGGLGVGLSLAKRLIVLHGGTLEAHSPPANATAGSEFVVKLPLVSAPRAVVSVPEPVQKQEAEGLQILIVDDNSDLVRMFTIALVKKGYTVKSAHNGLDGLSLAHSWRPDLVVLDIGLPGLDGLEVARRLRSDRAYGPEGYAGLLIALTGYGQDEDVAAALEAGFDAHLTKPCAVADLENLIAEFRSPNREATSTKTGTGMGEEEAPFNFSPP